MYSHWLMGCIGKKVFSVMLHTYIHVSIGVELAKSFWLEAQVYTYFSIVQLSVVAYIHIIFPATLYISSTFCIHTVD